LFNNSRSNTLLLAVRTNAGQMRRGGRGEINKYKLIYPVIDKLIYP